MSPLQPQALLKQKDDEATFELPPVGRPRRQWPWGRLATGVAIVVAVGSAAAAGYGWWDRTTTHSGGPLLVGVGINGQRLAVGEPTSFNGVTLRNRATKPAILERVRIVGLTGGFEVLGVQANRLPIRLGLPGAGRSSSLAGEHVVPVSRTHSASGEPEDGLQLMIGARATAPGVARARGVEISYRIGPRHYRRSSDGAMYLCAPKEQFDIGTCPGDAKDQFDNAVADFAVTR